MPITKQRLKRAKGRIAHMKVTTNTRYCKGCGICVELCPKKVLELDALGKIAVVRDEDCIECGQCQLRCPDYAIYVTGARKKGA